MVVEGEQNLRKWQQLELRVCNKGWTACGEHPIPGYEVPSAHMEYIHGQW